MTAVQPLEISVIICAYTEERWEALAEAVSSAREQTVPAREVIVVIDHNPVMLERAKGELNGATVIANTNQRGLSGARNSGIAAAKGSVLAFLDDDARATPHWIANILDVYGDRQVVGVGGILVPIWESPRRFWFPEEFFWVIGCSYRGVPSQPQVVRNPFGGNMSLRRDVFESCGLFRDGIGRVGRRPVGCEETEMCIRVSQLWPGAKFFHHPAIEVHHRVPAVRNRWRYFCSRCWSEGLSKALVSQTVGSRDSLSSEWAYTLHVLPKGVMRGIADAVVRRDPSGLARSGAIVAGLGITGAGFLVGRMAALLGHATLPGDGGSTGREATIRRMDSVA